LGADVCSQKAGIEYGCDGPGYRPPSKGRRDLAGRADPGPGRDVSGAGGNVVVPSCPSPDARPARRL